MISINRIVLLASICLITFSSCASPEEKAVEYLAERVTNGTLNNRIEFKLVDNKDRVEKEFFEISPKGKKVKISANSQSALTTGFNWYLKYVAHIHICWNNLRQNLPELLPLPTETIRHETEQVQRYYLNYCTHSYSMPFWDWERWEQEIDWMALHGVNLPLHIVGVDVVWRNVLRRLKYTDAEINEFIAGPAYHAWWLMNNLEGWGGPKPQSWYDGQEVLSKKITHRMKELGISPVVPGYAGTVPSNSKEKLGFDIVDMGKWCSFSRPAFLSTDDPNFDQMATLYYEELEKIFGDVDYFSMDPFHEGGKINEVDLDQAGKSIMNAMKKAHPDAVWVVQAWQACPYEKMIRNLKKGDLLVLDLYSEKRPQWGDPSSIWYRKDGFLHHDWLYCMLLNFGGNVGLHGRMDRLVKGFYDAKTHLKGKNLKGVGTTPEGIENNPVMFELLYELPWRNERFSCDDWLLNYLQARYGHQPEPDVIEAWKLLKNSVYNAPINNSGEGTVESLLCARPGFDLDKTSTWGWATLFYNPEVTCKAADLLAASADQYESNPNFQYDLIDVTRQSNADRANFLLKEISKSYHERDIENYEKLSTCFLQLILQQDQLLSDSKDFSLTEWVSRADHLGKTPEEKALYRKNALMLVTVWGNKLASNEGGLHEYSHREWSGLLSGLYYYRWKLFFDSMSEELRSGKKADPIDWYVIDSTWINNYKLKDN